MWKNGWKKVGGPENQKVTAKKKKLQFHEGGTSNLELERWLRVVRAQIPERRSDLAWGWWAAWLRRMAFHTCTALFVFCKFMEASPLWKCLSLFFHFSAPSSWPRGCFPGNKLAGMGAGGRVQYLKETHDPRASNHMPQPGQSSQERDHLSKVCEPGKCWFQEGRGKHQQKGDAWWRLEPGKATVTADSGMAACAAPRWRPQGQDSKARHWASLGFVEFEVSVQHVGRNV